MKFQSDILNKTIILPECVETTALGAIFIAGLGSGYFKNLEEIKKLEVQDKIFKPTMDETTRNKLINNWNKAIKATRLYK